jgi:hypothetical protein
MGWVFNATPWPFYPLYRRLGGPQGRSVRVRKISPPTGIRSPDRPARSECCTDWAIQPRWETNRIFLYNRQGQKSAYRRDGRAMPHRLVVGLLIRNPGFHPGPVDVMFGTGTGLSRSTSVFLVSFITYDAPYFSSLKPYSQPRAEPSNESDGLRKQGILKAEQHINYF